MLVVSIPASDSPGQEGAGSALEVGGANGQAALEKLQHVVGRTADHWRPANAADSSSMVGRAEAPAPEASPPTAPPCSSPGCTSSSSSCAGSSSSWLPLSALRS